MKRRILQEAVAENLDVIRGLPPRALRPAARSLRMWARRAPLVVVPLILASSSYLVSGGSHPPSWTPPAAVAAAPVATLAQPAVSPILATAVGTERLTASGFPLSVRRVVLDAGHGGSDPGAISGDVLEKQITLDIGKRLRTLLERNGFDVVLTRERDETVPLKERARVANDSRSDIFVSIHVNTIIKHTQSRGIETYHLGSTNDPSLSQLAASENRVSGYSISDMRKLLDRVYADARGEESRELATAVQSSLFTALKSDDAALEDWGVKRAPFIVLVATDMPAVLAEVGCISNEKEAAMLRRPEYRQKIANALFEGIRAYSGANSALQQKGIEKNG